MGNALLNLCQNMLPQVFHIPASNILRKLPHNRSQVGIILENQDGNIIFI